MPRVALYSGHERDGKLVDHGYRRPGTGTTYGRCSGVGQLAYELSCDWLKTHLPTQLAHLSALAEDVRRLQTCEVTYFVVYTAPDLVRLGRPAYREYAVGVSDLRVLDLAMDRARRDAQFRHRLLRRHRKPILCRRIDHDAARRSNPVDCHV